MNGNRSIGLCTFLSLDSTKVYIISNLSGCNMVNDELLKRKLTQIVCKRFFACTTCVANGICSAVTPKVAESVERVH